MLRELITNRRDKIYIHVPVPADGAAFLKQAEAEGIAFGDGARPTTKHISDFYALYPGLTLCYINTMGRIAYQCRAVECVEYSQLKQTHSI